MNIEQNEINVVVPFKVPKERRIREIRAEVLDKFKRASTLLEDAPGGWIHKEPLPNDLVKLEDLLFALGTMHDCVTNERDRNCLVKYLLKAQTKFELSTLFDTTTQTYECIRRYELEGSTYDLSILADSLFFIRTFSFDTRDLENPDYLYYREEIEEVGELAYTLLSVGPITDCYLRHPYKLMSAYFCRVSDHLNKVIHGLKQPP